MGVQPFWPTKPTAACFDRPASALKECSGRLEDGSSKPIDELLETPGSSPATLASELSAPRFDASFELPAAQPGQPTRQPIEKSFDGCGPSREARNAPGAGVNRPPGIVSSAVESAPGAYRLGGSDRARV